MDKLNQDILKLYSLTETLHTKELISVFINFSKYTLEQLEKLQITQFTKDASRLNTSSFEALAQSLTKKEFEQCIFNFQLKRNSLVENVEIVNIDHRCLELFSINQGIKEFNFKRIIFFFINFNFSTRVYLIGNQYDEKYFAEKIKSVTEDAKKFARRCYPNKLPDDITTF